MRILELGSHYHDVKPGNILTPVSRDRVFLFKNNVEMLQFIPVYAVVNLRNQLNNYYRAIDRVRRMESNTDAIL